MKRLVAHLTVLIAVSVMAVPASADDALIAKQIISKLNQQKQAANLKGFDLGVQVDKGTVTMMGQVATSDQAMLALDVARRIPGVKLVVNDLYVNQQAVAPQPQRAPTPAQPAIQTIAAQQHAAQRPIARPVAYQQQQPSPHYNATGAIGSAVAYQAQRPVPFAQSNIQRVSAQSAVAPADYVVDGGAVGGYAGEMAVGGGYGGGVADNPQMPGHAWPSYASSPNYGAVTYPQQYSATAWPYIGPFYPYPQVPLGWRKVSLEWDDGWWHLDFTKK